jgi:hypothetical protein
MSRNIIFVLMYTTFGFYLRIRHLINHLHMLINYKFEERKQKADESSGCSWIYRRNALSRSLAFLTRGHPKQTPSVSQD